VEILPTLFCFELMLPTGYESGLVKLQLATRMGIFGCDDFTVFSSRPMLLGRVNGTGLKVWTTLVYGSLRVKMGGVYHTALNTPVFIKVWRAVVTLGLYKHQDWTAKVDPDAVFFPQRLRNLLIAKSPTSLQALSQSPVAPNGVYLVNCKFGLHGPVEILTSAAVTAYVKGFGDCDDLAHAAWGEDWFMDRCLQRMHVQRMDEFSILREDHCGFNPSPCTAQAVAFHPFKKQDEYADCWRNASLSRYGVG